MTKQSDTPRLPDLMEAVFDTCYLLFDLIAGILFFACSHGSPLFLLYGVLTWTLCFTMTVFYILLLYIWKQTFYEMTAPIMLEILIWVSAAVRIVVCMLPQNNWCGEEGNRKLSVIRNAVFAVTGICVIVLYVMSGNTYGYHMTRMAAAIVVSFGCYLPVTLLSKKMPKIGMLMIPKTCAYIWMIVMGLRLLF